MGSVSDRGTLGTRGFFSSPTRSLVGRSGQQAEDTSGEAARKTFGNRA